MEIWYAWAYRVSLILVRKENVKACGGSRHKPNHMYGRRRGVCSILCEAGSVAIAFFCVPSNIQDASCWE